MSKSKGIRRGGQAEAQAIIAAIGSAIDQANQSGDFASVFSICRNAVNARAMEIIKKYSLPNIGDLAISRLESSDDRSKAECGRFLRIAVGTDFIIEEIEKNYQGEVLFPAFSYGFLSALSLFASIVDDSNVLVRSAAIENQETAQRSGGNATGRKSRAERDARLASLMPFVRSGAGKTNRHIARQFLRATGAALELDTVAGYVREIRGNAASEGS